MYFKCLKKLRTNFTTMWLAKRDYYDRLYIVHFDLIWFKFNFHWKYLRALKWWIQLIFFIWISFFSYDGSVRRKRERSKRSHHRKSPDSSARRAHRIRHREDRSHSNSRRRHKERERAKEREDRTPVKVKTFHFIYRKQEKNCFFLIVSITHLLVVF